MTTASDSTTGMGNVMAYIKGFKSADSANVSAPYGSDFAANVGWTKGRLDAQRQAGILVDESSKKMKASLGVEMFEAVYGE